MVSITADSVEDEGLTDIDEVHRYIMLFDKFGLALYMRKVAKAAKMAADRLDYAEHLRGNTLEEYVKEE